jgi:hypothetical protein
LLNRLRHYFKEKIDSNQYKINLGKNYELFISILGLILVIALTVYPPRLTTEFAGQKTITGLIFGIICLFGVLVIFSPKKCRNLLSNQKKSIKLKSIKKNPHKKNIYLEGHHPNCGNYNDHIFKLRDKNYCAACLGLLIGGLLDFGITLIYFFLNWPILVNNQIIILLGIFGIIFGLFQFKFKNFFRLLANTFFVLGALLILIGIDMLLENLIFNLLMTSLITFWLITRIKLSQLDHKIICSNCEINCSFSKKVELTPTSHRI